MFRLDEDSAFIPANGAQKVQFTVIPLLTGGQSYKAFLDIFAAEATRQIPRSSVVLELIQSDGRSQEYRFRMMPSDMASLLRANANRCAGLAEATFENGCIGMPEENISGGSAGKDSAN
jgi:hypothetical protein